MNGPRSNNYHSRQQASTLDTLSRTIDDLEAKILGSSNASNQHDNSGYSLSDEIRARQQSLSGARAARNQPLQNRQAPQRRLNVQMKKPPSQVNPASHEISSILGQLRQELRQDMQVTVQRELAQLHNEMSSLGAVASQGGNHGSFGADLEAIAQSLKQIEQGQQYYASSSASSSELDSLRLEMDNIRSLVDTMAREETLTGLDNRWSSVEESLRNFDPSGMQSELAGLSHRLQEMREALVQMPQSGVALNQLEDKVELISSAIAELLERPSAGYNDQIMEMTGQTEARLAQLAQQVEALAQRGDAGLSGHFENMSARLNQLAGEIANQDVFHNLEARIGNLQASLDNGHGAAPNPQLDDRLLDIANKVEALGGTGVATDAPGIEHLVSQLSDIAFKLDQRPEPVEIAGFERLESQLADISSRLEGSTALGASVGSGDSDGLQEQIARLSDLMTMTNVEAVSGKLDSLEEHLNTNDEFVFEVARQAAEATLEAYNNASPGSPMPAEGQNLSALSADLNALETLYRSTDDRNTRAFEAVQDTLLKIADRLEQMNNGVAASAPTMPPAATLDNAPPVAPSLISDTIVNQNGEPLAEEQFADDRPARGASSLLASLTDRIKRDRGSEEALDPAQTQQVSAHEPSALSELDSEFADEPLEPGSGAPDIESIMEKVRDVQKSRVSQGTEQPAPSESQQDYLASARSAALAAAAEVGTLDAEQRAKSKSSRFNLRNSTAVKEPGSSLIRKPVIMVAGALLLVILSIPLASRFLAPSEDVQTASAPLVEQEITPETAPGTAIVEIPTDDVVAPETNAEVTDQALESSQASDGFGPRVIETGQNAEGGPGFVESLTANQQDPVSGFQIDAKPLASDVMVKPDETQLAAAENLPEKLAPIALKQAALSGDPIALYEIGSRYADGRGTAVKLDQAVKWIELSANQNFAPAQYRLANFYEKGTGVNRDVEKAKNLYEAAANNGNVNAMHNLGVLYASSSGAGDFDKAADWFRSAAEHGVRDSQVNIAILYARGEGVARDLVESYKWFAIAAIDGDTDAATKRDEVFNALTPDNATLAREKVAVWKVKPVDTLANSVNIPDSWAGEATNTASIDMKKAIMNIQAILNNNGFDAGRPDGVIGAKTTSAIKEFQDSIGMKADGKITDQLVQELLKRNG